MTPDSLRRLRWFAIAVPVAYLIGIWVVGHDVVPAVHHHPWVWLLAASVLVSIARRLEQLVPGDPRPPWRDESPSSPRCVGAASERS
ncbi:MAG: hypothetical protein OEV72_06565 [Thermoleophilia bacterium]|nr:hypothetical protein [Thermoleophilia bacterium]MDH5333236.1 hypothetical protein [Thermoleophilia bacterium]